MPCSSSAAVNLVGGVLVDQSEADRDLSAKQRLGLAAGSTIQGAGGFAGDIEPLADALDVAGWLNMHDYSLSVNIMLLVISI